MFNSNGKIYHKSGNRFKLFPFVTQSNSAPVQELDSLVGNFLCRIEEKKTKEITAADLVDKLKEDTEIQAGQEDLFFETIRQLFFTSSGAVRPLNLQMIEQIACTETSESRIAEYLVDTLGEQEALKKRLIDAKRKNSANVLEAFVLSKLEFEDQVIDRNGLKYFRIVESLRTAFEEDFAFVLDDPKRLREYLVALLEFYFFSYTAQTSLQLSRFMDGERDTNIPLYFCLEWEKTSQSRQCFTEGWQKLHCAAEKIFAHAITLEILNQTEAGSEVVDYIRLNELVCDDDADAKISKEIDALTKLYRSSIGDCIEMNELEKTDSSIGLTAASIKYLFDSIRVQFENTGRVRAYRSYANKFESYCKRFLKSRGRSGLMLNLSEEDLIFITKLCIKDQEQVKLKDVFKAFERRGIFLDDISKEQVADYYEKLNLIEKKSDSGDAKYVKRIL
jgi:DNA phosphorothioation-dependent restriction protein DptG